MIQKNRKIAVITFHSVTNHGSVLQTLATKKKLESRGLDVEIVNYKREHCKGIIPLIKHWNKDYTNPVVKLARGIILFPSFVKWKYMFARFLRKYVEIDINSKSYTTEEDFKDYKLDADIYCIGSDQVWNSIWNDGLLRPLFLSFVPDTYPKVAFSSSFGRTELFDWEKEETGRLLKTFDAISLREENGLPILEELGVKGAVAILDPTLLMDKEFWNKYTPPRLIKENYLLVYQLYSNREFDKYAEAMAQRKGLRFVRFTTRYDQFLKKGHPYFAKDVEEFLSLIKYASLLITDSFHGTAFATNFNVQFLSFIPKFGGRIYNLLKIVGLDERAITHFNDLGAADKDIDFEPVNKVLEKERAKADRYIDYMLEVSEKKIQKNHKA